MKLTAQTSPLLWNRRPEFIGVEKYAAARLLRLLPELYETLEDRSVVGVKRWMRREVRNAWEIRRLSPVSGPPVFAFFDLRNGLFGVELVASELPPHLVELSPWRKDQKRAGILVLTARPNPSTRVEASRRANPEGESR